MQAAIASLQERPAYLRAQERLLLLSFSPKDQVPEWELDFLLTATEAMRRDGKVRSDVAGIKQRRNGHDRRLRSPTMKHGGPRQDASCGLRRAAQLEPGVRA
jgi:hypothetical protein